MERVEYEIQHFGFSARQLSLERRVVIKTALKDCLRAILGAFMKKAENISKATSEEALELCPKIAENIYSAIKFQAKLEEIEDLDTKTFTIPDNVLLWQDFDQAKSCCTEDEEKLNSEIEFLKKSYHENAVMIAALELENAKYADIENIVQVELDMHEKVQEAINSIDVEKTQTQTMVATVLDTLSKAK